MSLLKLFWRGPGFATHLLESRTNLRYIQELLGYKSSKTAEIYTHVSERDIGGIKNPLNTIGKGGNEIKVWDKRTIRLF